MTWWQTIVGAGLGTALAQPLLQWLITLHRERRDKNSQAEYLAMRLAVILEEFLVKCIYRAWHDDADLEQFRDLDYDLPTLASYPQDSDWRSLDPKLAGRVLSFPNEIAAAGLLCQFERTREGNSTASANEVIVAGVNAWRLAQDLRKKYKLDPVTIVHADSLQKRYQKIQQAALESRSSKNDPS